MVAYDTVIRNALVVDGTGSPGRRADVAVRDGEIVAVGTVEEQGSDEVDADGLVLAPGFIDIHTHYDAQILWDPDLTPSSWHGVTTAVMGNCGFGIAPTRPDHRESIARTLENVEGMSFEALAEGIPWEFESFPEYLDAVDRRPKRIDVAVLMGHTPLRLYVLGDEATEREATDDEIETMKQLVADGLRAGAIGFATSKADGHVGDGGRPVPSRLASLDEIRSLTSVLGDQGTGVIEATTGTGLFIEELGSIAEETGRPVTWAALFTGLASRGRTLELLDRTAAAGGTVFPQIACRPIVMQINLAEPFPFARVDGFDRVLSAPREERAAVYRDLDWRASVRDGLNDQWGHRWSKTTIAESNVHADLVDGKSVLELAQERGVEPFDLICDLSLDEDLATRFRIVLVNDDEEEIAELLRDERAVLGLSDAGAHASQLCDAGFSTHLLGHWVRGKQALTLEQAVWRLTGHPADLFGLSDRGLVEVGRKADLVLFDPAEVACGPLERRHDQPAGADRLVAPSVGIEQVWVSGECIRRDGQEVDAAYPGKLVRGMR